METRDPRFTIAAVILDAVDLEAESSFWQALLGGDRERKASHHILRIEGQPVVAIQYKPDHIAPVWPDGEPQQMHLDLAVDDIAAAESVALAAGAKLLSAETALSEPRGYRVYADPAGHPFCLTWG